MKYYYAVLTHGITRKLDILLLTVAVALGFFGLDAVSYTHLTLPTKA